MDGGDARDVTVYAEFDVGNLCAYNVVNLNEEKKRVDDSWLKNLSTAAAQALINKIWELPTERNGPSTVIKLPDPAIAVPREKPLPRKRPPTKWEQYTKKKHIQTQKKEKLVWDENSKEWKPRYGFRSIKNTDKSNWLVELPDNADPNVNYFNKRKEQKSEAVAKNELHRLRNISSAGKNVSSLESVERAGKEQLLKRLSDAKTSTASMGKFTKKLPKEKAPRNNMKKRKFAENIPKQVSTEKENNLKIFSELNKKKPKLDIQEAVQAHIGKKHQSAPPKRNASEKPKKQQKKTPQKTKQSWKSHGKRNRKANKR